MATRMQQRRGTASQWTSADPILAAGEIGFETDTGEFRVGDGVNHWSDLSPFKNIVDLGGNLDDYVPLTSVGAANGVASLDSSGYVASGQLGNVQPIIESVVSDLHTTISGEIVTAINNSETSTQNAYSLAINTAIDDAINTAAADATTKANTAQSNAETTASGYVSTHSSDTTDVHGISNTANLVYTNDSRLSDERTPSDLSVTEGKIASGAVTSAKIADGTIVAGDIANATITNTKIADDTITNAKINSSAAIAATKISGTAVTQADTGTVTSTMIADGTIVNGDINASAAIAQSKIANLTTDLAAKAPLASPTFTGTLNAADVVVSGSLTFSGTAQEITTTNLSVTDSLIYLADQQYNADAVDIGIYGAYGSSGNNAGNHPHTGLVRDASDGKWKLISGASEPTNNVVDFTGATYDTLKIGSLEATSATIGNVSNTELQYLDGVTSAVQTQIDAKAPKATPSFTGGVTVDSSGIIFTDGTQTKQGVPSLTSINQQTASYTGVLTDRDKLIEINSASATTLTIPTNASVAYPVGTSFDILQTGAGQVTIAGAGGVTVNATPGLKLRTQWSSATLFKRATDTWVVFGDLSA